MSDAAIEAFYDLDLNRFYRIYTTIHEMLHDRGYTPNEEMMKKSEWTSQYLGFLAEIDDDTSDLDLFGILDSMTLLFTRNKKQLLVYFHPLDSKLAQNDMSYIRTLMSEKNALNLIMVANNNATPKVSSVLEILGHNAQLFSEEELLFNVTRHQLVPKHTLVTGEEREQILKTFTTLPDGKQHIDLLPGMFTNDAIVKYYNFRVDDLIRIDRPRKDGFVDISYRVVIYPITEKDKKGN